MLTHRRCWGLCLRRSPAPRTRSLCWLRCLQTHRGNSRGLDSQRTSARRSRSAVRLSYMRNSERSCGNERVMTGRCRQPRIRDRRVTNLADALEEMHAVEGHLLFKCCNCPVPEPVFQTVVGWTAHIRDCHSTEFCTRGSCGSVSRSVNSLSRCLCCV